MSKIQLDYTTREQKSNPFQVCAWGITHANEVLNFLNNFIKKFIMIFIKTMPPLGYAENCWYY